MPREKPNLLDVAMHAGFFLLMAAGASRLLIRHPFDHVMVIDLTLAAVTAVVYATGVWGWSRLGRVWSLSWLAAVLICWLALTYRAPSFAVVAVPLLFLCLRLLSPRATVIVGALLTAAVIVALLALNEVVDPSLVLVPIAIAGMTVATVLQLKHTRGELAASQHRTGVLEERTRLAREIHDTLAQGLSGIVLLLQNADRSWGTGKAREHVRLAEDMAARNLAEARAFVRDLSVDVPLLDALTALAAETGAVSGADVRVHVEGDLGDLPPETSATLLRVAQGALANVREHARARNAVVTVSRIGDHVNLDVRDDGTGFDPAATAPEPGRGYGLSAMRERAAALDGYFAVETAPGDGTAVSVSIPVGTPVGGAE
ncbi:sensor histidine kinase [Phytomonospora endophytica]|uniref:Oxygen sensor histidine kinase NreB n=1 Tax=Phytomonospora endophytica TaxID=714109 RepID=A0A841FGA2_9ACTN|nr:sensor histidine kinase [Phytomonospora endophytica]MBB6034655.1 signal transduction histidine kinase [Phytomonospora endophytica]GIG69144.1 two-component sensor histidine kinase [Phytomonospora endophytica]